MKSSAWFVAVGMTLVAVSCDPELSLEEALDGKRCRAEGTRCLEGYVCDDLRNECVLPQEIVSEMDPRDAGGAGGSGTVGDGVDTMDSDVPDAADAAPSCTPLPHFRDRDGDTFGSDAPEDRETRCPSEGWVTRAGDCFDAVPTEENRAARVHPEQRDFFPDGYPRPGQPGEISFDYDCSLSEEADPDNPLRFRAGDCAATSPTNCTVAGGVQTNARPGGGVDDRCGGAVVVCEQLNAEQCAPTERTNDIFRCR